MQRPGAQPTTLRGVFPDAPTVHRRNFIRENVRRIKLMQSSVERPNKQSVNSRRSNLSNPNNNLPTANKAKPINHDNNNVIQVNIQQSRRGVGALTSSLAKIHLDTDGTNTPNQSKVNQKSSLSDAGSKMPLYYPGIQKLECRPADRLNQHISDLIVTNNIAHRSMMTEKSENMDQIYAKGVIKYPTSAGNTMAAHQAKSVAVQAQQSKQIDQKQTNLPKRPSRRNDPSKGDAPEDVTDKGQALKTMPVSTIMPALPSLPSPPLALSPPLPQDFAMQDFSAQACSPIQNTDFIRNNVKALRVRAAANRRAAMQATQYDPNRVPPHYKKGVAPKYIKAKKDAQIETIDEDCPPGHVLLPEDERKETLRVLRESYAEKIQEMNAMPVRSDTLKMQKRKMDLENELKKIDEGIKVFQRQKVYVKVNI